MISQREREIDRLVRAIVPPVTRRFALAMGFVPFWCHEQIRETWRQLQANRAMMSDAARLLASGRRRSPKTAQVHAELAKAVAR